MLNYLQHPLHGQKVESNDMVATLDRANGWVDYDPSPKPEPVAEPVIEPADEPVIEPADEPEVAKPRGRKPAAASVVPDFLK